MAESKSSTDRVRQEGNKTPKKKCEREKRLERLEKEKKKEEAERLKEETKQQAKTRNEKEGDWEEERRRKEERHEEDKKASGSVERESGRAELGRWRDWEGRRGKRRRGCMKGSKGS